jgi:hypothetical protein
LSYSFNQKNKVTHKINELKKMTTTEYDKLQPEKFISHKKTVEFMKVHNILPKLG